MKEYKKRIIDDILRLKLDSFGGVLIVGPKNNPLYKQKISTLKRLKSHQLQSF